MIQLSTLPTPTTAAPLPGLGAGLGVGPQETGEFADLLTVTAAEAGSAGVTAAPCASPSASPCAALPASLAAPAGEALRQRAAAPAMPTGKILPVLPEAASGSAAPAVLAAAAMAKAARREPGGETPDAATPAASAPGQTVAAAHRAAAARTAQVPAAPRAAARSDKPDVKARAPERDEARSALETDTPAAPAALPQEPAAGAADTALPPLPVLTPAPAPAPAPAVAGLDIASSPGPALPATDEPRPAAQEPSATSAAAAPFAAAMRLPPLIVAQMQGLPLSAAAQGMPALPALMVRPVPGDTASSDPSTPTSTGTARLLPASALCADLAQAAAGPALISEPAAPAAGAVNLRLGDALPKAQKAAGEDIGDLAQAPVITAPAMLDPAPTGSAPALAPSAPIAAPGHDFAAIVDRLIEARDAVRPQAVNVALDHAEFGQVSVQFRQDEGGLSVSVASADPDFARAVQAAVPATVAAQADASAHQNGGHNAAFASARPDSGAAQPGAGQSAMGQQGQNPGQGQSQSGGPAVARRPADNPAASSLHSEAPGERRGRFA